MLEELDRVYLEQHWGPALVNCDNSGLDEMEDHMLSEWYADTTSRLGAEITHFEFGDESSFEIDDVSGLRGDCVEVIIYGIVRS